MTCFSAVRGTALPMAARRVADGSHAFVYTSTSRPISVRLKNLVGPKLRAWWFDPRTGVSM